jgi:formaldehyde-activating enzyme involved in methanogenesis
MDDLIKSIPIPEEIVMNKIFLIRGMKVMMDKDLAELYQVQTRNLNKAVNRNLKGFPGEDFMFQLTEEESKNLMFHFGTSS